MELASLGDERQRLLPASRDREREGASAQQVELGRFARHRRHEVRAGDRVVDLAAHRLQQDRVGLDPFAVDRLGEVVERAHEQVDHARVVALAEEQVRRPPSPDLGAGRVVELVGVDRAQQLLDLVGLPLRRKRSSATSCTISGVRSPSGA